MVSAENGKHYNFERMGNFNYLGVTMTDSGKEEIEILERITKGTKGEGKYSRRYTVERKKGISGRGGPTTN